MKDDGKNKNDAKDGIKNLNRDDFREFIEGGERVLVDFWAPRCMSCRNQMNILDTMLRERQLPGGTSIAKVNVDDNPEIAEEFGIMNIPTMMVFRNGNVTRRYVGIMRPENIAAALED
ncbi:MAG: thioredoxin domain-containing protein [Planctomycetia bacterium]|nr:thioredoxin domain-containing protein [Planctomycetia bacterium]